MAILHGLDPLNLEDIKLAFKFGDASVKYVSKHTGQYIKLEQENIYIRYLLCGKKHYCGLKYTQNCLPDEKGVVREKPELKTRGLQSVRRDNWLGLSQLVEKCLNYLIAEGDEEKAKKCFLDYLDGIVNDKHPIEDYIETKGLNSNYVDPQPHAIVAKKIEERMPGSGPAIGDRVPLVYVWKPTERLLAFKAEDPEYVKTHQNIKLDRKRYIENMKTSFQKILAYTDLDVEKILKNAADTVYRQLVGIYDISTFYKKTDLNSKKRENLANSYPTKKLKKETKTIPTHDIRSFFSKKI